MKELFLKEISVIVLRILDSDGLGSELQRATIAFYILIEILGTLMADLSEEGIEEILKQLKTKANS